MSESNMSHRPPPAHTLSDALTVKWQQLMSMSPPLCLLLSKLRKTLTVCAHTGDLVCGHVDLG